MADGDPKNHKTSDGGSPGTERGADTDGADEAKRGANEALVAQLLSDAHPAVPNKVAADRTVQAGKPDVPVQNLHGLGFHTPAAVFLAPEAPANYGAVGKEIGKGALNEIAEHPFKVGGIAVGTGVVTELTTAFLRREALWAAGAAGTAWAAYKLCENAPTWLQSADVVAHGARYSPVERQASQKVLQGLGATGVDFAAGALGAGLARPVTGLGRAGWNRYTGGATKEAMQPVEAGLVSRPAAAGEETLAKTSAQSQAEREAGLEPLAKPYVRNDKIETPRGMPMDSGDEGKIFRLPGGKLLKVKETGLTSAQEEADALVALGDKGIRVPRVYEVGKTIEGHDALVMQELEGDSYRDLILSGDKRRLTSALQDFNRQIKIMSDSGVSASDIQFKNLIIGPKGEVYFIDPLRIVSAPSAPKVDRIIKNMILNGARP